MVILWQIITADTGALKMVWRKYSRSTREKNE